MRNNRIKMIRRALKTQKFQRLLSYDFERTFWVHRLPDKKFFAIANKAVAAFG